MFSIESDYDVDKIYSHIHQVYSYALTKIPINKIEVAEELLNFAEKFDHSITSTLKTLALMSRLYDDVVGFLGSIAIDIGILNEPIEKDKPVEICLREACNKIIHSVTMEWVHDPGISRLILVLHGFKKQNKWCAHIKIFNFLLALRKAIVLKTSFFITPTGIWSETSQINKITEPSRSRSGPFDDLVAYAKIDFNSMPGIQYSSLISSITDGGSKHTFNFLETFDINKMQIKIFSEQKIFYSIILTHQTATIELDKQHMEMPHFKFIIFFLCLNC